MNVDTFQYKIDRLGMVSNTTQLDRKLPCIEFNIGDPTAFPSGRVSESRLTFTESRELIRDGTIRMGVDQKQFTGPNDSLAKQITENMKIAVIDSIMHIYLIGPNPHTDQAPEHANINSQTVLQLLRFLDGLTSPYKNIPNKIESKFG